MQTLLILVSNLHCPSCVCHIEDVLDSLPGVDKRPHVSLIPQTIKVRHDEKIASRNSIIDALLSAAFEVQHVTVVDQNGRSAGEFHIPDLRRNSIVSQAAHRENCSACQQEEKCGRQISTRHNSSISDETIRPEHPAVITIDEPSPDDSRTFRASISVEGMTCGSCVGTVKTGLDDLPFVSSAAVDLLSNAATVEFQGRQNLDRILETIDDLGYEAALVEMAETNEDQSKITQKERVVELRINGMHCIHCPQRVVDKIEGFLQTVNSKEHPLRITQSPSVKNPRIQLKYVPSRHESITIRHLIEMIKSVDPSFTVSVYHPPTLEERSRRLQRKERQAILSRLVFAGIVAIPSFILGVVYMALVPNHNPTRMWLEEPLWVGNATRLEWALFITTTPVMFFGADMFHRRAFKEIWAMWRPKSPTPVLRRFYRFGSMNMLISVGTLVAYISSLAVLIMNSNSKRSSMEHGSRMSATYFDVITFLTFFILIGKYLEAYSKAKTGDTVAMLSQLKPKDAQLVEDGNVRQIPVDQLELGDLVRIPRGHSPPADGVVKQDGSFSFDESSLTGESKPVAKKAGDTVFTGTVNMADPVEIEVTELGGTSMLDQIIDIVRGGQAQRAPVERVADILTGYFVPVVTVIAIVTWVIWLSLGLSGRLPEAWLDTPQGGWAFWSVEFAIAVFVIACPCGIGLAAPTALFVGGGLAAKQGILAQGGGHAFQEASNLNTIVFDKTGTLTQGRMEVVEHEHLSETISSDTALAISRLLEEASTHPIAQAITKFCSSTRDKMTLISVKEMPGYGMTAKLSMEVNNQQRTVEAMIGNNRLIDLLNRPQDSNSTSGLSEDVSHPDTHLQQTLYRHRAQGRSVALLAVRDQGQFQVMTIFALADPLRPEAYEVVSRLQELQIAVHLCTGDNDTTALAIASQLNISSGNVRSNVLPQGKAAYIQELQHPSTGGRKLVAFVGDGLNDTPALTAADVSISLSSGSDIAMNASSFILLNSHLGAIHNLIKLSKRVFRRVKINFFWAAVYNVTLIPVAAGVFFPIGATKDHAGFRLSPVWAAVAMAGSSVSVVLSSLALRLPEIGWSFGR